VETFSNYVGGGGDDGGSGGGGKDGYDDNDMMTSVPTEVDAKYTERFLPPLCLKPVNFRKLLLKSLVNSLNVVGLRAGYLSVRMAGGSSDRH